MNSTYKVNLSNSKGHQEESYTFKHIDSLLISNQEWKDVPDIVKLSINSLLEILKSQNSLFKDIEKQMSTKATRVELNSGLSIKANMTDVMRSISDCNMKIEEKMNSNEVLEKIDILKNLNCGSNELNQLAISLNSRVSTKDFHLVVLEKNRQIEELNIKVNTLTEELLYLKEDIDSRATVDEVNNALNTKASKSSVIEALQRKVNLQDFEGILSEKVDLGLIAKIEAKIENFEHEISNKYNSTIKYLQEELNSKVNFQNLKSISDLLGSKLEIQDFQEYKSTYYHDIKAKLQEQNISIQKLESKLSEIDSDLDRLVKNIKHDTSSINKNISLKLDTCDYLNDYKKLKDSLEKELKDVKELSCNLKEDYTFNMNNTINRITNLLEQISAIKNDLNENKEEICKISHRNNDKKELNEIKVSFQEQLKDLKFETNTFIKNQFDLNNEFLLQTIKETKEEINSFFSEFIQDFDSIKTINQSKINELSKKLENEKRLLEKFEVQLNKFPSDFSLKIEQSKQLLHRMIESFEDGVNTKLIAIDDGIKKLKNNNINYVKKEDLESLALILSKKLDSSIFDSYLNSTTGIFQGLSLKGKGKNFN